MLELACEADFEAFSRIDAQVHAMHVAWRPDLYQPGLEKDIATFWGMVAFAKICQKITTYTHIIRE